jgi:isopenicillin-N N-acyltransferase like protein
MKEFPPSHILTLTGSPRQRGRMHGESLRSQIAELLGRWKEFLCKTNPISPNKFILDLAEQTNFTSAIERWSPDLLEETIGISEGAAADYKTLFAFQLQDEQWWFEQDLSSHVEIKNHCSSMGSPCLDGFPSLVAQNMDLNEYLDGFQTIFRILDEKTGQETLIFSVAGLIALNGMNSSIGIVCNNLGQLNHSVDGLPVAYVLRGVLKQRSLQDALGFLKMIRHASGQNYLVADHAQVIDLECSANQVVEYSQASAALNICHTNHPLINNDFRPGVVEMTSSPEDLCEFRNKYEANSCTRFDALAAHLSKLNPAGIERQRARELLSSHESTIHPVCCHPEAKDGWMTVGTSIFEMGDPAKLYVCPGPPCQSRFLEFEPAS